MIEDKRDLHLLTASLKKGKLSAFESIYNQCYGTLCIYGLRFTNDTSLIEDVVQDTFVHLWTNRKKINISISLNAYLYRIVHNKLVDSIKKKDRFQKAYLSFYQNYISTTINFSNTENDNTSKLIEKLEKCIQKLPRRCKTIFEETKINGLKYSEVSEKLNISIKTVEGHIRRGYVLLKGCMF